MDEDLDAVEKIRSGDTQAYAVLVRKYQGRVRGYCRGVLGNAADADDAAQEVFIKAYRGLPKFGSRASFSTWLYRITVNHCRDVLRGAGRGKTESLEALREQEGEAFEAQLAGPSRTEDNERERRVREALSRLPEPYREALVLRVVEGLSYAELADALACSLDAVKARLRRARREMTKRLMRRQSRVGARRVDP